MFYCKACAEEREYPLTLFRSRGRCELCNKQAICNDLPSKLLPMHPADRARLNKLMEGRCKVCGHKLEGEHVCPG